MPQKPTLSSTLMNPNGTLYLVATPIGNKEDITLRALRILAAVDFIAAEDTRHSKPLLQHYAINTPMISLHEFNQAQRVPIILQRLQQGEQAALISDAGTPLISDPTLYLVQGSLIKRNYIKSKKYHAKTLRKY